MNQADARPYWMPPPVEPNDAWLAPLLRWSLKVSAVGWIIYGMFAFAFQDVDIIHPTVQSVLVLFGGALIVAGSEMNTAPTSVAVFRKIGAHEAEALDVAALVASYVGSVLSALITFSSRQAGAREAVNGWRAIILQDGPLILGVAVASDYYAATAELGLLWAAYKREMAAWLAAEQAWNEAHGIVPGRVLIGPARMEHFKIVLAKLGDRARTITADELVEEFALLGRSEPSASSMKRYLRIARKGA